MNEEIKNPRQHIYDNWKAVTEADFVSLFIKTWFAYISTLRELFPEAYNRRGDGKYLKAYKEYYKRVGSHKLPLSPALSNAIDVVYRDGRKIIMEQYPEYFFWDFYHVNDEFEYTFKDVPPDKLDCLVVGLKMNRNRGSKWGFTLSGFVSFFGKHYGEDYNGYVTFACDISTTLKKTKEFIERNSSASEQVFFSWLFAELMAQLDHNYIEAFNEYFENAKHGKRVITKIGEIEKRALSIIWQVFSLNAKDETNKEKEEMVRPRNTYEIIQQRPMNYYLYHYDVNWEPQQELSASEKEWFGKLSETRKQNSILWYLDFVYRLRNALFHEIIDPLDPEWQEIFKNAYLVLKEIVDLNISEIKDRKTKELSSSQQKPDMKVDIAM